MRYPLFGGPSNDVTGVRWPQPTGYKTDMAKAKELMAESGAGPIETTISFDLGDARELRADSHADPREPWPRSASSSRSTRCLAPTGAAKWPKKSMPMMVNFFSGWLDYPEYFFFWCYSGQNAIFNTPSYVNKDMDAFIEGASAPLPSATRTNTPPTLKALSPRPMMSAADSDLPTLPQRGDAKEHLRLQLLVPPPGRLPLAGQGVHRAHRVVRGSAHACDPRQTPVDGDPDLDRRGHRHLPAHARAARRPGGLFRRPGSDAAIDRRYPQVARASTNRCPSSSCRYVNDLAHGNLAIRCPPASRW